MSHQVKVNVQFKVENFDALKTAFSKLGWNVVENANSRTYTGTTAFPLVAVNPDTDKHVHDIGMSLGQEFVDMTTDFYGGSIEKTLGQELGKLKQEFAAAVIEKHFFGAVISREERENSDLYLTVNI